MRVFMTGGTGFVGKGLTSLLSSRGHRVTVLSRSPGKTEAAQTESIRFVQGDPAEPGPWQDHVAGHDAVVNLAGASIFSRWNTARKERIRESRLRTTRNVVEAMSRPADGPPQVLLSASGTGFYGFRKDEEVTEQGEVGDDFLARLARDWEEEARNAARHGVRVVLCRFGIVLGRQGGALKNMLPVFRMGLASPLGDGKQWFPWIHEQDLWESLLFLLERTEIGGPVNCTAPSPVTNRQFTKTLAATLGRPAFLPAVPRFAIRSVLGEFGDVLLRGQKAVPAALLQHGFAFRFPTLPEALKDLT